jgi:hypothetical protein
MKQPTEYSKAVMDLFPWFEGRGFVNSDIWWAYVLCHAEAERLELLVTVALVNQNVFRLLLERDSALMELFAFSEEIRVSLSAIEATNLHEFAYKLIEIRLETSKSYD